MKISKKASVLWSGNFKEGKGMISTESGAMTNHPYGVNTRFEGVKGTNPEELIGAAHAGCFTMALALVLGEAKLTADRMETNTEVILEKKEAGFQITAIHLTINAKVPGTNQAQFKELANKAKENCPVSKLFKGNAEISLEVTLET